MFSSPPDPDRLWGHPSFLFSGYRNSFPGIKRPGREADHKPPCSDEAKNARGYNSTNHTSS